MRGTGPPFLRRARVPFATRRAWLALLLVLGLGGLGMLTRLPFLLAPLGPTIVLFMHEPGAPANRPLNVLLGHGVALVLGLGLLFLLGAYGQPSALVAGLRWEHVLASLLGLAGLTFLGEDTAVYHPPAGATLLLVTTGVLQEPRHVLALWGAVALLAVVSGALHAAERRRAGQRALGRPKPLS